MSLLVLAHMYHVYADGQYEPALREHVEALVNHGLMSNLTFFGVGLVGSERNRAEAMGCLAEYGLYPDVLVSASEGYEQLTLEAVKRYAGAHEDARILYAHTKGASNPSDINIAWRSSMCYHNVVRWRDQVDALDAYDVAGCHWLDLEQYGHSTDFGAYSYFGGTYWWANANYVNTLPPLDYGDRWGAEQWIGTNPTVRAYDANPGWPAFELFTTRW